MDANNSTICHECGSSVAEAEAFCPYCGISLHAAEPFPEVDESMESTIMMPMPAADAPVEEKAVDSNPTDESSSDLPSPSGSLDAVSEELSNFDDIPEPAILSDFSRTEGSIPTSTSEYSAEEIVQEIEPEALADEQPALNEPESKIKSPVDSTPPEIIAVEAEDVQSLAVESEPLLEERLEPADEEKSRMAAAAGDHPPHETPQPPANVESISKPLDDLSPYDSYQSQSMFDSVRIMEPGGAERTDFAETQIHPDSARLGQPKLDSTDSAPPVSAEVVSSTSHNIGIVDTDGKKTAKLKPLSEGTILNGRYEIIRKIGGGGMGAVYLASDNNLGGVLRAVKEMVQTHIEEEQQEKAINDFKRESMILSSLDHVSIPTIYDYFYDEKESRFYLVMKYISGGDLSARLRSAPEGRIDEKSVCEWAVQIIDVLDYLHNQPSTIVYRDLKPSNIMIDGNSGRAMLIDFGIARSISQKEEKGVTAVGTMGYAPPELFSGNVEPRSDIYSLGSTMFHLLTGADPQSNPLLIFDFQKNPRPRQINPQLSDQVERLIMKAVQYNADERFKSAAEMRNVLDEHLIKLKGGIVTYGVSEVPASVSLANQSVFCGFCGQRIVATDMFCAFCGAKQPIAQHGVHAEIYSQAAWTAKLVIEGTSELAAPAFSLQKDDNLLGRRDPMSNIFPEVDLSKYDPQTKISRRHARIWRDGNNFLVEDLGSSNGTVLSRSAAESFRLPPKQPQVLSAGDRLRLGDATLHFIIG